MVKKRRRNRREETIFFKKKLLCHNLAVFYGKKEFVFDGTKWHEFGDLTGLSSKDIGAMTNYAKAQSASAIETSDTLNQAVGKLEYKVDVKQNEVLGSWTAGTATSHSTPTGTDTVLEALQKIDNNQRNDETNISSIQDKSDRIVMDRNETTILYFQGTQPPNPHDGDCWINCSTTT